MGRTDTKRRAEDTVAGSVQKHRVLQDLIYYSCLGFLSVSLTSWATLHCHNCCGCFTNMSEFVTTLLGGVISKWGSMARRDEGDPFSAVSGSPSSAARVNSQEGKEGRKKDLQTLRLPSQQWKKLLVKGWLYEEQGREPVAHSCQPAVQLQPRTEVLSISASSHITVRLKRIGEPKSKPLVFRLSWVDWHVTHTTSCPRDLWGWKDLMFLGWGTKFGGSCI